MTFLHRALCMVLLVTCWSTPLPELAMTLDTRRMTPRGGVAVVSFRVKKRQQLWLQ